MSYIVYGSPDAHCAVGVSPPQEGGYPLPFLAFFRMSDIPKGKLEAISSGDDVELMLKVIKASSGFVVYFDNPDSAERFHTFTSMAFSLASRSDWAEREEIKETIN